MNPAIKHLFHIQASRDKVFAAISTIEGLSNWWTVETSGNSESGGIIHFGFASHGSMEMKLTEILPNEKITWECIAGSHGWSGNTIRFLLDENEGKTRVRFSHDGWASQDDSYASVNFSWGRYLESLRQYCQTGHGEAFGSAAYRR